MTHNLVFSHVTDTDAVFICGTCAQVIGFNEVGIGEPAAIEVNGVWQHPQNPDQWMTPCE